MNFDEIVVKESPGLCRCCLSEGCYKDLSTEYTWMNDTEVYADMLLECFDISISQHNDGPNGGNRLICEVCITRLRDACNFKKQVLDSEKKFVDLLARGEFQPKVIMYQAPMKSEQLLEESVVEDAEVEYLDESMDYDDDLPLKQPAESAETYDGDAVINVREVKVKRGRPKKSTTVVKTVKTEKKKAVKKPAAAKKPLNKEITPAAHRRFLTLLLENSTVMPFRWFCNKFMCFYCYTEFVDSAELKEHTRTEHEEAILHNLLKAVTKDCRVKIDVSNVSCKRCSLPFKFLSEFIEHASNVHDVRMDSDYNQYVNLFKLSDDLKCLQCNQNFKFFGTLLSHIYKYHNFESPFLCEICGQGFLTISQVTKHSKKTHSTVMHPCKQCSQVFRSYSVLRSHNDKVHRRKTWKCAKCPETFKSRHLYRRHLGLVHDMKNYIHSCEDCSQVYCTKGALETHRQKVHLKLKTVTCEICGYAAFNKSRLKTHLVKHSDERPFECQYCKKTFRWKRNLVLHVRIHEDDRQYACKECGKAFVQIASLKCHVRTHQLTSK